MRNLKKVLSLTLALVMLLGMMVVGAGAAEYTDAGEIDDKYVEAVSVMSAEGVKILNGKDDSNFDPKGTLKRSEAAKIITVMLLGESTANAIQSTSGSSIFTDVPADHWASGVIAYCANQGIILGTSDTTFEPDSELTGTQFAAMILRALGIEGEFTGPQWAINVVAAANKAKLVDKVTLGNTPISREAAAQLGFNGLKYSPSGEKSYVVDGQSYDSFIEAYIASGNDATKITVTTAKDSLAKTVFGLTEDTKTDAFGRTVRTWSVGDDEIFVADVAETAAVKVYTKKTGESTIDKDLKGYKFADDAVKYVDGVESDVSGTVKTVLNTLTEDGASVEVYASNKVISKVVKVRDYVNAVTAVTPARGEKARTITVGGMTFETESFEKGDVVVYNKANNKIASVVLAETVESVKVTSAKLDGEDVTSFSVDGTDYNFSAVSAPSNKNDANLNNIVTLYLDSHGFVGMVEKVEGTSAMAYVLAIGNSSTVYDDGATYYAKLLLTDGSVVNQAEIAKATVDANKGGQTSVSGIKGALATALEKKIVSFTEVDDVYTLNAGTNAALVEDKNVAITTGRSAMTLDSSTLYANANTIFLVKTGSNSYASYTGFDEVPNLNATAAGNYAFARVGTSDVLSVIYLEDVDASNNDVIFLLKAGCDSKATNDSTGRYYNCAAVVNGEITTVKLNATVKAGLTDNKLYKSVSQDKNGVITGGTTYTVDTDYKAGEVTAALENGVISIKDKGTFVVAEDATAFVCGDDIQGSDVSAIQVGDTVIFAVIKDGQITTVFYSEKDEDNQNQNPVVTTGDTYVKLDAGEKTAVIYWKNGTTQPTGSTAEALVEAALKADGYEVTSIADNESSGVDFTAKKGVRTIVFNWDTSNDKEAYVGTVDGKEVWIDKAADTDSPQLKNANIKNGVEMTGTSAKVITGTGLTGTPAKDTYVTISGTGVVITGNGFNVTSGFVKVAGTDYTTKYVALNGKLTVAKTDFGTEGTGTGFIYTMDSATEYAAYGEEITVTGDVSSITKGYVKVAWNVDAGLTGVAIDTTATDNTAYVQVADSQNLKVTVTKAAITGSETTTKTATVEGVTADGAITVTPAAGKAAITFSIDASAFDADKTITVKTLVVE